MASSTKNSKRFIICVIPTTMEYEDSSYGGYKLNPSLISYSSYDSASPIGCNICLNPKYRANFLTPFANKILDQFNSENSTDYELVDCVALVKSTLEFDLFVHCNFTAKPHKYPFVAGDYSTKLFYAEIRGDINGQINASKYSILHGMKTELGCKMCPNIVYHPISESDKGPSYQQSTSLCLQDKRR
ncbi:uncharacterized protein LOC130799558 isoform X2 [Amaranthus tricolor]|uniref:uncharacterized protein LOC130799558 isoform X2 n=1 Tax=Amaranthus tricolor TaxID=29722 RepID=UPI00258FA64B|nr:uncharacterized protein LOC130799558 isoform X2 [Amaranthus tricolor]